MVGIEEAQQRGVALKQIGEEQDRFFVHVSAQARELGKVFLALLLERIKVIDVQPLAGELGGQPPDASVRQHAPDLLCQHLRVGEAWRPAAAARSSASGCDDQRK